MLEKPNKCGFWDMFYIPFRVTPLYTTIFAILNLISALLPTLLIFVTAEFINTAILIFNQEAERSAIFVPVAVLTGVMVYNVLIGIVMSVLDTYRNNKIMTVAVPALQLKATRLEYWLREDPDAVDLLLRADMAVEGKIWAVYSNLIRMLNLIVFVAGIFVTLFTQVWWVALTIIIISIPLIYISNKAGKELYDADREMTEIDRQANYFADVLTDREAV